MSTHSRQFDVVVFGATGFTGRLVAEYLAKSAPSSLKWALAGRSLSGLEQVKRSMVDVHNPAWSSGCQLLQADSENQLSVDAMVSKTRVVINMVGPYLLHGTAVVDSCVRLGTHYVDITGESHWVRRMIDAYQQRASEKQILIVSFCGFDSVPSDLGTWMTAEHCRRELGEPLSDIKVSVVRAKGGFSGGTILSGLAMQTLPKDELQQALKDPFLLNPRNAQTGSTVQSTSWPAKVSFPFYDSTIGRWQVPFIMAGINSAVVRRSVALQDNVEPRLFAGDARFSYLETSSAKSLLKALWTSWIMLPVLAIMMSTSMGNWLIRTFGPKSGSGPSEEVRRKGLVEMQFNGTSATTGKHIRSKIMMHSDPGYSETAKMVSECAMCLALDFDKLPSVKRNQFGLLTPSVAFGNVLVQRLRNANQVWEVSTALDD